MTDIKVNDSLTSDGDADGINLINSNVLSKYQNMEMSSDASNIVSAHPPQVLQNQQTIQKIHPVQIRQPMPMPQQRPSIPQNQQISQSQPIPQNQQIPQRQPIPQIQHISQRPPNPQIQHISQRPPNPQIQHISQPQFLQTTNTQLNEPKCVTFNENVEQKNITPDNEQTNNAQSTQQNTQQNTQLDNSNLVTEIKKIKLGKLMVPRTTLIFTIILIALGVGLFFVTKPKSKRDDERDDEHDDKREHNKKMIKK
jgi:hypothetical protein